MGRKTAGLFAALILLQACHSVEEFVFRLWEVLPPARFVSGALGLDPAAGFAVANSALVLFGLWSWGWPVRRGWPSARRFMWGWAVMESANGLAHLALAAAAGGYFPGLGTAPLLILAGAALLLRLIRHRAPG